MIQPITTNNNISFNGFYSKTGDKFSPNQYFVAKDIKNKLGQRIKNENYMVSTGAIKDSVELWKVNGLTTGAINGNEIELEWKEADFIGTYSKEAPFKAKDLERKKSYAEGMVTGISLGIIATAFLLICGKLSKTSNKNIKNTTIENYQSIKKDTLQLYKNDSLQILK